MKTTIKFKSFTSGSCGTCYFIGIFSEDDTCEAGVLVDAGFSPRRLKKELEREHLGYGDFAGLLITHDHNDHIRSLGSYCKHLRKPVWAPPELAGEDLPADLALLRDVAHTVRDADKLDIFRVLENLVATTDWRRDRTAFWNLSPDDRPNPEVVKAIAERRPVDYQHIRSLADFVLIQVGWMVSGLYFRTSRRICRDRGHLAFRRRFLGEIGAGKAADEVCDLAEKSLG